MWHRQRREAPTSAVDDQAALSKHLGPLPSLVVRADSVDVDLKAREGCRRAARSEVQLTCHEIVHMLVQSTRSGAEAWDLRSLAVPSHPQATAGRGDAVSGRSAAE